MHAQIPARGTCDAQVYLPAHAHVHMYIQACTKKDSHTCSQAPACPYSHFALTHMHTHSCTTTFFSCTITSHIHYKQISHGLTSCRHTKMRAGTAPLIPTQCHGDTGAHALAKAHRHNTDLLVLTCTNTTHAHAGCARMLRHPRTTTHPAVPRTRTHGRSSSLIVFALLQTCTVGGPTHSLTQACSHSLTFHRDLSNGFYDSQTGHGHTRVVGGILDIRELQDVAAHGHVVFGRQVLRSLHPLDVGHG